MPVTRKQKSKARESREADMISDLENWFNEREWSL